MVLCAFQPTWRVSQLQRNTNLRWSWWSLTIGWVNRRWSLTVASHLFRRSGDSQLVLCLLRQFGARIDCDDAWLDYCNLLDWDFILNIALFNELDGSKALYDTAEDNAFIVHVTQWSVGGDVESAFIGICQVTATAHAHETGLRVLHAEAFVGKLALVKDGETVVLLTIYKKITCDMEFKSNLLVVFLRSPP